MKYKIPSKPKNPKKEQEKLFSLLRDVGIPVTSKSKLPDFIKNNSAAIGGVFSPKEQVWCTLLQSSPKFIKFADKLSDIYEFKMPIPQHTYGFPFFEVDMIVDYTKDNVNHHYICAEHFMMHDGDDFSLWILPWEDGVMVYRINVNKNKRGCGIGSKVMNLLYDISEETDCPIYLIPFPDDNYKPSEMINEVNKLKDWYSNLHFGPIDDKGVIWSNY